MSPAEIMAQCEPVILRYSRRAPPWHREDTAKTMRLACWRDVAQYDRSKASVTTWAQWICRGVLAHAWRYSAASRRKAPSVSLDAARDAAIDMPSVAAAERHERWEAWRHLRDVVAESYLVAPQHVVDAAVRQLAEYVDLGCKVLSEREGTSHQAQHQRAQRIARSLRDGQWTRRQIAHRQ